MELFVIPPDKIAKRPVSEGRFYEPGDSNVDPYIIEAFDGASDSFFAVLGSFARAQQTGYSDVDGMVFSLHPKPVALRLAARIRDHLLTARRNSDFTVGDEKHQLDKMKFGNVAFATPENIRFVCGRRDLYDNLISEWHRFFTGETLRKRLRQVSAWIASKSASMDLKWSVGGYREAAFVSAAQELLGQPDTISEHLAYIIALRDRLHSFHRSRDNFLSPDAVEALQIDLSRLQYHRRFIHAANEFILKGL